jgi:hypothetical protein
MVIEIFIKNGLPPLKIREKGVMTDIFGKKRKFKITKVIPILEFKLPKGIKGKVYVLQKLEFEDGREYFRFGYYIMEKNQK